MAKKVELAEEGFVNNGATLWCLKYQTVMILQHKLIINVFVLLYLLQFLFTKKIKEKKDQIFNVFLVPTYIENFLAVYCIVSTIVCT